MFRWDDIKVFLAVARTGSMLGATEQTGTSQSTANRRIEALEEALGIKLVDRRQTGTALTDQGRQLLTAAEELERAADRFLAQARAGQRELTGTIRVTMPEGPVEQVLTPPIAAFKARFPRVRVEIIASPAFMDVGNGEVDVAIRTGPRPTDPRLVARLIGKSEWCAYASPEYLENHGKPSGVLDLKEHAFVGAEGPLAHTAPMRWLTDLVGNGAYSCRAGSIASIASLSRASLGVALLPVLIGDQEAGLERCFPPIPDVTSESWVVTRDDVRKAPHVRAFLDFLGDHLVALIRKHSQHTAGN